MPFLDVDTPTLVLGALAFFAGGAVKGVMGIGLPLILVPLLATVFDLPTAVAIMVVPVMATNLLQAYQGGNYGRTLRRFWPLLLPMVVTTLVAAQFLARIDVTTGGLVLGLIVMIFVASQALPIRPAVSPRLEYWLKPPVGLVAGFLGGLSNLFGPVLVMFLVSLRLPKDEFVQAIAFLFLVGGATLYLTLIANGLLTLDKAATSLLAALPALAGVWLGQRFRSRIRPETFNRFLLILLFVVGLNLVRRGLL